MIGDAASGLWTAWCGEDLVGGVASYEVFAMNVSAADACGEERGVT